MHRDAISNENNFITVLKKKLHKFKYPPTSKAFRLMNNILFLFKCFILFEMINVLAWDASSGIWNFINNYCFSFKFLVED